MLDGDYQEHPCYIAQCKTWVKARELGVAVVGFREEPERRNLEARQARRTVAKAMREERRQRDCR